MRTLTDLFLNSLAEIYYAENQLLRTVPKLASADTDAELREALDSLLEGTELYVKKVERVFAEFGQRARAGRFDAIAGLLEQGNTMGSGNKGLPTTFPDLTHNGWNAAAIDHRDDSKGRKAAESQSNTFRRHSSSEAATFRLQLARSPTRRLRGMSTRRRAAWDFRTGSD